MNPKRASPAATHINPAMIDIAPAMATASAELAAASGRIVATSNGVSDESGPSTMIRDGPKIAYTNSGTMVAYRPVTGGNPAAEA